MSKTLSYHDAPRPGQMGFQSMATPQGVSLVHFYHVVMLFGCCILGFTAWWMFSVVTGHRNMHYNSKFKSDSNLEFVYTLVPFTILAVISAPSLSLLYMLDNFIKPMLTIQAIGHQWYWDYVYGEEESTESEAYSSYMTPAEELKSGQYGIHESDHEVEFPLGVSTCVQVYSVDVIHCWVVNAYGVKTDAVPGHCNSVGFLVKRSGCFFGMCSEICGSLHAFMPIKATGMTFETWLVN